MWIFPAEVFSRPENNLSKVDLKDYAGFVYLITRKSDGKKYVGQKQFWEVLRRPPLKGKIRARVSKVESQWKTYFGSNDEIKADVLALGEGAFTREILRLCKSKSEMNYFEAKEIFARDAILVPDYYNKWVNAKIRPNQIKSWK